MIKDWKYKWIDGLLSGEYKQGRGRLKEGNQFCCLGVLCDLVSKEHPEIGKFVVAAYTGGYCFVDRSHQMDPNYPTLEIRKLVGLEKEQAVELAKMNDNGASFFEIANYIRENL